MCVREHRTLYPSYPSNGLFVSDVSSLTSVSSGWRRQSTIQNFAGGIQNRDIIRLMQMYRFYFLNQVTSSTLWCWQSRYIIRSFAQWTSQQTFWFVTGVINNCFSFHLSRVLVMCMLAHCHSLVGHLVELSRC